MTLVKVTTRCKLLMCAVLILTTVGKSAFARVAEDPIQWLDKMYFAAKHLSFQGVFMKLESGEMQTMKVERYCDGDVHRERISSLSGSGPAKKFLRRDNKIWYKDPQQDITYVSHIVDDHSQLSHTVIPKKLRQNFNQLSDYYDISVGKNKRIAGREAVVITINPKDNYRYGLELTVDRVTGLVLASSTINAQGEMVKEFMFQEFELIRDFSESEFDPDTMIQDMKLVEVDSDIEELPLEKVSWVVENMPPGFELTQYMQQKSPMSDDLIHRLVFTDGLSVVSLFIKKPSENRSEESVDVAMGGGVHAAMQSLGELSVTAMGEVPQETVALFAQNIREQ